MIVGFLGLLFFKAEGEADMRMISSILSGPIGLIIGYYFGQSKK